MPHSPGQRVRIIHFRLPFYSQTLLHFFILLFCLYIYLDYNDRLYNTSAATEKENVKKKQTNKTEIKIMIL